MQPVSPYRFVQGTPAALDQLIPPDRRRLHAAVLAFFCVILGASLLRAAEALLDHLDQVEATPPLPPPPAIDLPPGRPLALLEGSAMRPSPPIYASNDAFDELGRDRRRSKLDLARGALLVGNAGLAKQLMMPVVASGRAGPEEVRLLRAACEGLADRACIEFVRLR